MSGSIAEAKHPHAVRSAGGPSFSGRRAGVAEVAAPFVGVEVTFKDRAGLVPPGGEFGGVPVETIAAEVAPGVALLTAFL